MIQTIQRTGHVTMALLLILALTCSSVSHAEVSRVGSWTAGSTHVPGAGANRVLVLFAAMENVGERDVVSVTYGGQALTEVAKEIVDLDGRNSQIETWVLAEAGIQAATDNTFVVSYAGTPSSFTEFLAAATFQGVDQSVSIDGTATEASISGVTIATGAFLQTTAGLSIAAAVHGAAGTYDDAAWGDGWSEALEQLEASATFAVAQTGNYIASGIDSATATHNVATNRQVIVAMSLRSAVVPLVVDTAADSLDGDTSSVSNLLASRGADGWISLREAIIATNNTSNAGAPDQIHFDIGGSAPHTIPLTSALPAIIDPVIIDGTTEPDFAGTPVVVLEGIGAGAANGLTISAGQSTVRGLVIQGFMMSGIHITAAGENTIEGNRILGNQGNGVFVDG